jgi:predicted methyltransferase
MSRAFVVFARDGPSLISALRESISRGDQRLSARIAAAG